MKGSPTDMMVKRRLLRLSRAVFAIVLALSGITACADEGIWLFNEFPRELVSKKYGFDATDAFLNHLRLASLRIEASGSFVSPRGLIFTNHHVASDCIQQLSSAEHDYMSNGFYASRGTDEKKCPDMEANVLLSIKDVTEQVNAGIDSGAAVAEANRQRKANMARIEKDCAGATGNRCDVVTLYSGGAYHLYEYRKYTDIRLVFAPEVGIAAFGGDPDNFTYPRYCLDIAFVRAYENGRAAETPEYLRWSREGVKDGELTFVSGNPASTGRLDTVAQLEFFRDYSYPLVHRRLESLIRALEAYSAGSAEKQRVAKDNLFSQQNSYKAYTGFLAGLRDPKLMEMKKREEQQMRMRVERNRKLGSDFAGVWREVAEAYRGFREEYKPYWLLETAATRGSELFRIGRGVLRLAEERTKPNEQRLAEYRDSALPSLEASLFADVPIAGSMEVAVLADYFRFLAQELGPADPAVDSVLGGKTPEQAAENYVTASRLKDVAERKRLAAAGGAVEKSEDGMIRLARILDPPARRLRKQYEDQVEAVLRSTAPKIAQARFVVLGRNSYPDGTFTLRLSYGPVKGYENDAGKKIAYATTFEGLYRRATGQEPYRLPERWVRAKSKLDLATPFNFVTTADTHGGNSGSPTVNTKGEVIGILFDGNIESLPNRFVYTEEQARSIHVASQGIVEALRKVYRANRLLDELNVTRK